MTRPSVSAKRRALAALARAAAPGYGSCYRCGMPWKFTEEHVTDYSPSRGCFPLCEGCWGALTPQERVPFYEALMRDWNAEKPLEDGTWEAVLTAVHSEVGKGSSAPSQGVTE